MCNCENKENNSVLPVVVLIIAALSFIIGFIAGSAVTKSVSKKNCSCGEFDADEYVRSLNFDDED